MISLRRLHSTAKIYMASMLTLVTLQATPIKIMPLGDSLTYDDSAKYYLGNEYNYTGPVPQEGERTAYRSFLAYNLTAAGVDFNFVGSQNAGFDVVPGFDANHEGHSGWSTSKILGKIDEWLALNSPDIVLLHAGINDSNRSATGPGHVASILDKIKAFGTAHNKEIKVVVALILNSKDDDIETIAYNTKLDEMLTERNDPNIKKVDMEDAVPADEYFDKLHPTKAGYKKMAQKWFEVLESSGWLNGHSLDDAVNLWHLNETGGTNYSTRYVDSKQGKNLTSFSNEADGNFFPDPSSGKVGGAQHFDHNVIFSNGSNHPASYSPQDNFTIECWVKPVSESTNLEVFMHQGHIWIGKVYKTLRVELSPVKTIDAGLLTLNIWNHVAVVKEGSTKARVYINGVETYNGSGTKDDTEMAGTMQGLFTLGAFSAAEYFFNGDLDEVAIYNTALTKSEVQEQYTVQGGTLINDTIPPVLIEVTAIPNPTDSTTPSYVFSSTEAGNITLSGSCGSATPTVAISGNNTITFAVLAVNTYEDCTLVVTDEANNASEALAIPAFAVGETNDTTPPVITLTGASDINVSVGITYVDAGATASDDKDGDITANIVTVGNTINTSAEGNYTITYDVNDTAKNKAIQVKRTVHVVAVKVTDTTPPVITLTGASDINVSVGITYVDAGATASDDKDGDITANIVTVGNTINTSAEGNHTITYNVNDAAGNLAVLVVRQIHVVAATVVDTTIPVITLTGGDVDVVVGTAYIDAGATAHDNIDGDITSNIVTVGNTIDTSAEGTHTITYNVNDAAKNKAIQVKRTVHVVAAPDIEAPVITLKGDSPLQIIKGNAYTEYGASAEDDVDGNLTDKVKINTTQVNISVEGNYTVTYTVSDKAGNNAESNRTVQVLVPTLEGNTTDTDNDKIPDVQDTDDDNDGVLDEHDAFPLDKNETTDLDGDGIGDNADTDDDGNGIEDSQEQKWFTYKDKMAIVAGSTLKVQGLGVNPSVEGDMFTLTHTFGTEKNAKNAYLSSNKIGEVHTGFKAGTIDDTTLKIGTSFKTGTNSVIKMDAGKVLIRIRARFNKNDTFEIGGK